MPISEKSNGPSTKLPPSSKLRRDKSAQFALPSCRVEAIGENRSSCIKLRDIQAKANKDQGQLEFLFIFLPTK